MSIAVCHHCAHHYYVIYVPFCLDGVWCAHHHTILLHRKDFKTDVHLRSSRAAQLRNEKRKKQPIMPHIIYKKNSQGQSYYGNVKWQRKFDIHIRIYNSGVFVCEASVFCFFFVVVYFELPVAVYFFHLGSAAGVVRWLLLSFDLNSI